MIPFYILVDGIPKAVENWEEFNSFCTDPQDLRRVCLTCIGDVTISTVFLTVAIGWDDKLFFETMIFGGKYDLWRENYQTWEEAEDGHVKAVRLVRMFDKKQQWPLE